MNPIVCCRIVLGCVNPPIGEALPGHAKQRQIAARRVVNPKRDAVIHAEVKFREITLQMLFATMLVCADHPALKDREEAFQRVGMNFLSGLAFCKM